jgi:alkanal monooxygenase alpha chain
MRWGLYLVTAQPPDLTQHDAIQNSISYAELAEKLGYDDVWVLEHHFTRYGLVGSPLLHAAYVLGRTQRIKVGTAINILPLDHPIRLAEQVALLDQMSKGRILFGVGRGAFTKDFKVFNVDMGESREMMIEWTQLIVRAWTTGRCSADNRYIKFPEVEVLPQPFTKPHPPIYTVPQSPSSVEWAAKNGYPMILNYAIEDEAKVSQLELYAEHASAAGFDPGAIPHALSVFAGTASDGDAIRAAARKTTGWWLDEFQRASDLLKPGGAQIRGYEYWQRQWEEFVMRGESSTDKRVEKYLRLNPIGSPAECVEKLQRTVDLTGIKHVISGFEAIGGRGPVMESIQAFTESVIPKIKDPTKRWS